MGLIEFVSSRVKSLFKCICGLVIVYFGCVVTSAFIYKGTLEQLYGRHGKLTYDMGFLTSEFTLDMNPALSFLGC
jgi:hypothetical protein